MSQDTNPKLINHVKQVRLIFLLINIIAVAEYLVLLEQKIGGAVIDVWYNYIGADKKKGWPSNYPFHNLENVILSAHESAWTREQIERRWKFVAGNLERVEQNLPPENLVFYGEQSIGI